MKDAMEKALAKIVNNHVTIVNLRNTVVKKNKTIKKLQWKVATLDDKLIKEKRKNRRAKEIKRAVHNNNPHGVLIPTAAATYYGMPTKDFCSHMRSAHFNMMYKEPMVDCNGELTKLSANKPTEWALAQGYAIKDHGTKSQVMFTPEGMDEITKLFAKGHDLSKRWGIK